MTWKVRPEGMPFSKLSTLIVIYESVEDRPPAIQERLDRLWAEVDRRKAEAAA